MKLKLEGHIEKGTRIGQQLALDAAGRNDLQKLFGAQQKADLTAILTLYHQSKWLVLQFFKYANPRLGITDPDGLDEPNLTPKMYDIT